MKIAFLRIEILRDYMKKLICSLGYKGFETVCKIYKVEKFKTIFVEKTFIWN